MKYFIVLPVTEIIDTGPLPLAMIDEATLRQGIFLIDQQRENIKKDFEIYFLKEALAALERKAIDPGEQLVVKLQAPERKAVKLFGQPPGIQSGIHEL